MKNKKNANKQENHKNINESNSTSLDKSAEITSNYKSVEKRKRDKRKGQKQQQNQPQNFRIERLNEAGKVSQEQNNKDESIVNNTDTSNYSVDDSKDYFSEQDVKMNDFNESDEESDEGDEKEKVSKKQKTDQSNVIDGAGEVPQLETNGTIL
jgi:hypothetical protein